MRSIPFSVPKIKTKNLKNSEIGLKSPFFFVHVKFTLRG